MASVYADLPDVGRARLVRAVMPCAPQYARFLTSGGGAGARAAGYRQQYSHIYTRRLAQQRPLLRAAARARWPDTAAWKEVQKIIALRGEDEEGGSAGGAADTVVIGASGGGGGCEPQMKRGRKEKKK